MTPPSIQSPALAARHGFFTRAGGVSVGPYASLNCAMSGADDPAHVAENRDRVRRALGGTALVGCTQVHGVAVETVVRAWAPGQGPRADGMVTAVPGLVLGVITADCAPVLFQDAAAGVVGAVHAGWRGAVAGVLEAAVAAMLALGATRGGIVAAVGPCIGQASYEVGEDLREAVLVAGEGAGFFAAGRRPGHWQFNLAGYCAARLAGPGRVEVVGADTCADEARFFSHRRRTLAGGGAIGHQISAIVV